MRPVPAKTDTPGGKLNDVVSPVVVEAVTGRVLNPPSVVKTPKANPAGWRGSTACDP